MSVKKYSNRDGLLYTDEEVIELRDWLYHMADIVFDIIDREDSKRQMELINRKANLIFQTKFLSPPVK